MKKLLIDLDTLEKDKLAKIECSYFYHSDNNGLVRIYELANFAIVCRKCKDAPCVASCPKDALEKNKEDMPVRLSMRCIACKSCSHACPFGTIYSEIIPYLIPQCDYCINKLEKGEEPLCVRTSSTGAIKLGDFAEDKAKGVLAISDNLLIKVRKWERI